SLVKKIDQRLDAAAGKTARPAGAFVIFVNNADGLDRRLRALAEKEGLKRASLCIGAGPGGWDVAPEADANAVSDGIGRRRLEPVTANFAFRKGELNDARADAIVKALSDVLPPQVHTVVAHSREKEQRWRYTFGKPGAGWFEPDFDDSS